MITSRAVAKDNAVIGCVEDPCVSVDLRARPESLVIAPRETLVSGDHGRIFGGYDNEWGFSNRMADTAVAMGKLI